MRKVLRLTGIIFGIVVIYLFILWVSRINETPVVIRVIPKGSVVKIDGKATRPGTHYLSPGEYEISAEKEGWSIYKQTIEVRRDKLTVNLLPTPDSGSARAYLYNNPELQLEREKLGGENAALTSQSFQEKNPITELLPHLDAAGPFSLDYGPSKERPNDIFLLISDSTPSGRIAALKWIRQQGYDPTDFEIRYDDYYNPLEPRLNEGE